MKRTLPLLAGLLALAAPLGAQNIKIDIDPSKPAQPATPAAPAAAKPAAQPATAAAAAQPEIIAPVDGKYSDVQKMEFYGYMIAQRLNMARDLSPLIRSDEELVGFLRGLGAAMAGSELPYDMSVLVPQAQTLLKARGEEVSTALEKMRTETNERNQKEAKEFLATLDAKPSVKKTASGLRYEILAEGKGAKAKPTQAVRGYVKTTFVNGDVLVDPKDKDGKPVAIEMALEPAIAGLKEGLQLTGVGGKLKLYVPAELGYGDKGMFPGALTVFEIELLEVKEPTKQPEEKK
ncbi:MAG TPA: FKBP-type peptidyl-prolyl cis-trans isomerase [Opitutaceae bacterium]|nr:FKBP-type peptidyl-prolyl cis-trans isomerase [Opitutaceae bacterium]